MAIMVSEIDGGQPVASASDVIIRIYNVRGQIIRTLNVGHKEAGFYLAKGKAAYWDGCNALGEPVASGIYFYQLITPEFQQVRQMVILR